MDSTIEEWEESELEDLLRRACHGSREALEELLERTEGIVRNVAKRDLFYGTWGPEQSYENARAACSTSPATSKTPWRRTSPAGLSRPAYPVICCPCCGRKSAGGPRTGHGFRRQAGTGLSGKQGRLPRRKPRDGLPAERGAPPDLPPGGPTGRAGTAGDPAALLRRPVVQRNRRPARLSHQYRL